MNFSGSGSAARRDASVVVGALVRAVRVVCLAVVALVRVVGFAALAVVGLGGDLLERRVEIDLEARPVGLRDLDLPDPAALGVALDRGGAAAAGDLDGRRAGALGLRTGRGLVVAAARLHGRGATGSRRDDHDAGDQAALDVLGHTFSSLPDRYPK